MDPDRPQRALNFEKSCVSFFDVYYERNDRMSAIAAEMTVISELGRMASLAEELRGLVDPLLPKLYDVYSASVFEGLERRNAKLLRHSARVVELLTLLNSLRAEVDAQHMSEVAQQYSRAVEGVSLIRGKMMWILES